MNKKRYTRRDFIRVSTLISGGLLAGFYLPGYSRKPKRVSNRQNRASWLDETEWTDLNVYVRIAPNNLISIITPYPEIGQGIRTSMPMLIAEELDADWNLVSTEQAETDQKKYGSQFVGGSTSMLRTFDLLRKTGASLRTMFLQAAAEKWNIDKSKCYTQNSYVIRKETGEKLSYGELATQASKISPPENPILKNRKDFEIIGKRKKNLDTQNIITGKYQYGMDIQMEDMLVAVILRPPIFGTQLKNYNATQALKTEGVVEIFTLPNAKNDFDIHRGGIVVLAKNSFAAIKARDEIKAEWTPAKSNIESTEQLFEIFHDKLKSEGEILKSEGDFENAYQSAEIKLQANYEIPFVAHATNEPQNTTVYYNGTVCQIWSPTQVPNYVRSLAAKITGLDIKNIIVNVTGIGGGFGRRLEADYAAEAIYVAMHTKKPVKVFWTREDDFSFDYFRPAGIHQLKAGIKNGKIVAWDVHHTSTSELTFNNTHKKPWAYEIFPDNYPPAFVPNLKIAYSDVESNIAVGPLRAPGHNTTSFADGSFMDEIAHSIGVDPIQLHLDLIGEPKEWPYNGDGGPILYSKRIKDVILEVKEKSDWGKKMPKNSAQGFAFHFTFGGYAAMVTEVSISEKGQLKVDKITAVADIGQIVNPAGAEEQMIGGIIDGLNLTLNAEVKIIDGKVVQQNFDTYPMLRMADVPEIKVSFINTYAPVGGVGEMGLPPVAPSLCNAIFAATGKRIRSLPVRHHKLL